MLLRELNDISKHGKAGFLPYVMEDGEAVFLFMIPSDTRYGGDRPSIAKGRIEHEESTEDAALREAEEELGLKTSNLKPETVKLAWKGMLTGLDETYEISVFMGEVNDKEDFGKPHFETGSVHWLTAKQFTTEGRKSQVKIINAAASLLKSTKDVE
jgi:8-oxo-dGTP pyrophosphatase MutT (NUDIX family)